ncbi:hypothetical protein SCAR479_03535 [Seiridium cardinale]|uniref:Extracellular membrane protein CFEM domain-containing protein n=1 Tax=Seiridium cardinale TaxID=138064 RepID=A0ABR2Y0Q3_9PEZI
MRLSTWAVLLFYGIVSVIAASSSSSSSSSSAPTVPACGEALKSSCGLNITCICTNDDLKANIKTCVLSSCTIREALQAEKYSYNTCGITGEDRTSLVWHLGIAFMITGLVAFGLRCLERLRSRTWGWDDWAITVVTAILVPMGSLTVPLARSGLGLDMWNVSPDGVDQVLYYFYWEEILYAFALALNKISILLFYLRVFPQQSFRVMIFVMIGLNVGFALAFGLAVVFQCQPLDGAWRSWDGEYQATCVNINYLGWSGAGVNILFDVATLMLPLRVLAQLTMSLRKKIQILAMFAVGFFVTLVSILRLRSMIEFGSTKNATQDYVEVGYWSTIEISIGIVCACMPAIRALLSHTFPLVFGGTRANSSGPASPYPFSNKKSGQSTSDNQKPHHSENSSGGGGGVNKSKTERYSKYGNSTKITVQNEWTVIGNHANRSDVELVAMEKKLPFRSDTYHVSSQSQDPKRWSGDSEKTVGLPIQGQPSDSL